MNFLSPRNKLIDLDADSLGKRLGRVVTTLEVAIAKNLALGISADAISEILGGQYSPDDIREVAETSEFKEVFQLISQHLLEINSDTSISWDQIEHIALKNLVAEIQINKDPELNLRVAAVANKAQRRHTKTQEVLDPSRAADSRVTLQLTQRFINRLSGQEEVHERRMTLDSVRNPTGDQIASIFSPQAKAESDAMRAISDVKLVQEPVAPPPHKVDQQRSNDAAMRSRIPPVTADNANQFGARIADLIEAQRNKGNAQ